MSAPAMLASGALAGFVGVTRGDTLGMVAVAYAVIVAVYVHWQMWTTRWVR